MPFERPIKHIGHSGDVKIGLTRKVVIMAKSHVCIYMCVLELFERL